MKNILFILLISLTTKGFSQDKNFVYQGKTIELEDKMIEHFDAEYIGFLKENNIDLLLYLNFFSTQSYRIEDIGVKKQVNQFPSIFSLKKKSKSNANNYILGNSDSFNILAYEVNLKDEQQVFVESNSSKALIVLPKKVFMEKYNDYKNSLK
ncbi:MAG: hypothetical protein H6586_01490 [Flavobacteriales bacterium]|nr:hypothetical protein [Flavobacteriales bacterium]